LWFWVFTQLNLTSVRNHDTAKLLHGRSLGFLDCMNEDGNRIFKLFSKSFHWWIYLWREISLINCHLLSHNPCIKKIWLSYLLQSGFLPYSWVFLIRLCEGIVLLNFSPSSFISAFDVPTWAMIICIYLIIPLFLYIRKTKDVDYVLIASEFCSIKNFP
jgi:hypothetical protein